MAKGVFLDTVGLIALLNEDDGYHRSARDLFAEIGRGGRHVVTTNLVLAEVGNGLARTTLREDVVWLIRQLHADSASTVVHVNQSEFFDAVDLYAAREDKSWGLVDCASFIVMWRMGLADAFTADRHFDQAGFHALLS